MRSRLTLQPDRARREGEEGEDDTPCGARDRRGEDGGCANARDGSHEEALVVAVKRHEDRSQRRLELLGGRTSSANKSQPNDAFQLVRRQ